MKKITLLVAFMLAFVSQGYAQFPESFEGVTFPPTGWVSYPGANGAGIVENWERLADVPVTGQACAYMFYENVTPNAIAEDWLVTPQFTVTAEAPALQFLQAQQYTDPYGTTYSIKVSTTSQTDHASFTNVLTQTEADLGTYGTVGLTPKLVDLSAYVGQQIYVAFVMAQDDGDNWFVDDVNMVSLINAPLCAANPSPANMEVDVPVGLVTFSWEAPATGDAPDGYNLYYGIDPGDVTTPLGTTTETSIELDIQDYNFTFYWIAVPFNAAGEAAACNPWSFTTMAPNGSCLNAPFGQWPGATFSSSTCDGTTEEVIAANAYAGEYSVVSVLNGQSYVFASYTDTADDFVTIALEDGTVLAAGVSPVSWTADQTAEVRFYSHLDDQCGTIDENRTRSVICTPSAATPDFVSLQWPLNIEIEQGETDMVYGQVYEAGLTDAEPGLSGQAEGIEAWIAVYPENTDPATWDPFAWVEADFNAAHVSNNDEYMLEVGDGLDPGTYYYATRFRLDGGAYVYGGINGAEPGNGGNFWDGVTYINGTLTVSAPPAPNNDECDAAIALTAGGVYGDYVTNGTTFGATDSTQPEPTTCFGFEGGDVWFSVVVPASGSITIETGDTVEGDTGVDTVVTAYSGDCAVLTQVGCDDDGAATEAYSYLPLTGLTPGSTLYIRVYEYNNDNAGDFGISVYDASLSTGGFDRNGFSFHPNPVKNVLNLTNTTEMTGVQVYNLLGQQVMSKSLNATEAQLDLSALAKGAYVVKVAAGDQTKSIKVIKE